jgi:hypothetical protein
MEQSLEAKNPVEVVVYRVARPGGDPSVARFQIREVGRGEIEDSNVRCW